MQVCAADSPHSHVEKTGTGSLWADIPDAQLSVGTLKMAAFISMATCHTCSQTSRHQGANRDFLSTLSKNYSTPGSAGKHKTPQSSGRSSKSMSKTPGKDKTPAQTPRSSISSTVSGSSSTSSKSSSKSKNWVFQRLSKILMRDENQDSKKGGLKDFLSSL